MTRNRGQDSEGAGWEYVHVCVDDYSRLAYAEVLPDERQESATAFLDRAVRRFATLGVRIRRVVTDNGSCYRARTFLNRCRTLNIRRKFTRPYRPQTNGKADRFIQTLLREWAYVRAYRTSIERCHVRDVSEPLQSTLATGQLEQRTAYFSVACRLQRCWNSQLTPQIL